MPVNPAEAMRNATPKQAASGGAIIGLIIGAALAGVYVNEGGYADHPNDRGGKTMYGVTEKVARSYGYKGDMRLLPKSCDAEHPVCANRIYTDQYIEAPGFMPMASIEPAVLDELVDSAVLHGPARPSRWFHIAINGECRTRFTVPRRPDAVTYKAYEDCAAALGKVKLCVGVLNRMDAAQEAFFRSIVANNPSQRVFLRGWLRMRVGNVKRSKCGHGVG